MPNSTIMTRPTPQQAITRPAGADDGLITNPSITIKLINVVAVLLPFLGLIAAIILLWGVAFSWVYLVLLVGMYLATAFGITAGYHRFFTHKAFETPKPIVFVLGVLGSMAVQGSIIEWVAAHRRHHQHSDTELDPHSPNMHGGGAWGVLAGLWHAHMGWLFGGRPRDIARYVVDLRKDRMVRAVSALFPLWVVLGLLIPAVLGGLLTMSWMGVLLGFIWGGLVRVFFVHHVTWSINSICHIWGSRPFNCHDDSRNNAIFGVLGLGEGWHNNHHAFPTSARHGLAWWEIDVTYWLIRLMGAVGLARNIRVPARDRVESKRRRRAAV